MFELTVLASGSGSTFENLVNECNNGILVGHGVITQLIVDRPCGAIDRAHRLQVPVGLFPLKEFPDRKAWCEAVIPKFTDLYLLAGFLAKLQVPEWAKGRILNIHPSLLPSYGGQGMYGLHVHEAVVKDKCPRTGCTVHVVDDEYDQGPVLLQESVDVLPEDTADMVQQKVQALERHVYPRAVLNYLQSKMIHT
jgi:phosphoribosylglycinamide formyltransferase-1